MKITVNMDSSLVEGAFGFHVEILASDASSEMEALEGVRRTTKMLAGGRQTFFRYYPESNSERNFDTKVTHHKAYARFTVLDRPGEWVPPSMTIKIPSITTQEGEAAI